MRVGLPWLSLVAFVRISTHARAFDRPLSPEEVWEQVEDWIGAPASWLPQPTDMHADVLKALIQRYDLRGNPISDAHLAALAIEHGLTLACADTDFARFEELRWIDPVTS